MISTATAQTMGKAKVVRIKGKARFTTGNNVWQPLKAGDIIKPGAVIQTSGNNGDYVDLVLGDGKAPLVSSGPKTAVTPISYQPESEQNFVRISENSLLGIDKLTTLDTGADVVSETQLDLKAGRIMGSVKKMSAASKYEVKIPNGVAGIRGTVYDISALGFIRCSAGSIVIAYVGAGGKVVTQLVNAGQQFDAPTETFSPLPSTAMESMLRVQAEANVGNGPVAPSGPTILFTVDHTRNDMSPIRGNDPDHDGDNDRNPHGDTSNPPDHIVPGTGGQ